ncbi:hydrogenase [Sulfurimonas sp. SWIR-19]|uniref:proton-conducting transporter transmembrane domain-containing protein n=1 Tax=Sulfurimonas sp. SWIR-19 TaxID=2878390 RepID=UPI001CF1EC18|nr:proton-conducting transporter membrane subunit [Sulfurimonas sp. SWIR-19]UCN00204.1 hydrogenase [Sulfurimonas sp. SWIR-19]
MMLAFLLLPALIMFGVSFSKNSKSKYLLAFTSFVILLPIVKLFLLPKPYNILSNYLVADKLDTYVLLVSSIVGIGVTLALLTLDKHVKVSPKAYRKFYRFFAIFWVGLIFSILANHMGIYWIGLELATLSTVYMIKTNYTPAAHKEAWNYMIVGAIAVSLILFGIILMYASAKPILGEDAMQFDLLLQHAKEIPSPFLFEIGFAITTVGMFVKMGFFPMNLWLANIERASFYPVAALFSGILESAVIIGFFRFSKIAMQVNYDHLFIFVFIYTILTIFIVAFLIFRAKDFMRLFSLSGIEHMALIVMFWVSGAPFAALLHFGAHAFLKPALFLSTGVLESNGKYKIAGALRGYKGKKGALFWFLVSLFLLAIISLPPSPMFFSELYGFGAMIHTAKQSHHMLAMIGAILFLLVLLSIIFYRFVAIYQAMKYEGKEEEKTVYVSELFALVIFALSLSALLLPSTLGFLRSIS